MELICSICSQDLDIVTRWPRLVPNTGDTVCQICVQQIVDQTIDPLKIHHLQNDLHQLQLIKQAHLLIDDFPLNQSLLRILRHKHPKPNFESKLHNQTFEDSNSEETSIDSYFLEDLATSVKKPTKINLKRYKDQDDSFGSLAYSSLTSNQGEKTCSAHRRPLEVVCLQCQQMICTNCALFGLHKGHYIYSEEDIISILEMKASELTDLIEKIVKESELVDKAKHDQEISKKIADGQTKLQDKLAFEFAQLRKLVDQKEKQLSGQITGLFENILDSWQAWWSKNVGLEQECKHWVQQAQTTFEKFVDQGQQTKYWDLLSQTETMQSKGQQLQSEIRKAKQQIQTKMENLFADEITVKFYYQNIRIEEFCKVYEKEQPNVLLTSFQCQQQNSIEDTDLLNDVSATFMNDAPLSFKTQVFEPFSKFDNIPKPTRGFRSSTPKDCKVSFENQDPSLSPIVKGLNGQETSRLSTSRKKSQVPLKLQLYMDELKKGKYEAAEFTSLDLNSSDQIFLTVCSEIKFWKVKQLKLMKSRLTDDQLVTLLKALQGNEMIQSVNLSQNNLGDRAIDNVIQLIQSGMISPQLKNIILSQNKVNARNVKNKIVEIKKFGITITL